MAHIFDVYCVNFLSVLLHLMYIQVGIDTSERLSDESVPSLLLEDHYITQELVISIMVAKIIMRVMKEIGDGGSEAQQARCNIK